MIHGKIVRYDCSWSYLNKRHICPNCEQILKRKKREIIIDSESAEAKKYDFFIVDTFLVGKIKFVTYYFECLSCNSSYEISELKKVEKEKRA